MDTNLRLESRGQIALVTIDRPQVRNAVDAQTAFELYNAFRQFDADAQLRVAVLTGAGSTFCAGADLKALAAGDTRPLDSDGIAPMGPTRLCLTKPVIAAIEGYAVAGGLELALWCDLRVAAHDAVLGVFSRRFGVPLIDLGTIRLPRLIGMSRALDLILTGRGVSAHEALEMGLVNRLVEPGQALAAALELAQQLAQFPQECLRADRLAVYEQWDLAWDAAIRNEFEQGLQVIASGDTREGAQRFAAGAGRHGRGLEGDLP